MKKMKRWIKALLGSHDDPKVPETLEEAIDKFIAIISSLKKSEREHLLGQENAQLFAVTLHHNIGRRVRNEWRLWEKDAPLVVYMKLKYEVDHADDIYSIVSMCAYQKINNQMMTPRLFADACIEHWEMLEKGEYRWKGPYTK
jgi:hypothetical protein